jgi:hypothetical protein
LIVILNPEDALAEAALGGNNHGPQASGAGSAQDPSKQIAGGMHPGTP